MFDWIVHDWTVTRVVTLQPGVPLAIAQTTNDNARRAEQDRRRGGVRHDHVGGRSRVIQLAMTLMF